MRATIHTSRMLACVRCFLFPRSATVASQCGALGSANAMPKVRPAARAPAVKRRKYRRSCDTSASNASVHPPHPSTSTRACGVVNGTSSARRSSRCRVLERSHLDIHGSGEDLKFTHHDNEIAQFKAFYGAANGSTLDARHGNKASTAQPATSLTAMSVTIAELKQRLDATIDARDSPERHAVIEKIIEYMMHGMDMSPLFSLMIKVRARVVWCREPVRAR